MQLNSATEFESQKQTYCTNVQAHRKTETNLDY